MALRTLIALAVPAVLVGNMLWLLVTPAFVRLQYTMPEMPADVQWLVPRAERELGATGARAVHPAGEGVVLLERARLGTGRPALTDREIRHMRDVRTVVSAFFWAWGIALIAGLAAALALRRQGAVGSTTSALQRGGRLTLAVILLLGLAMALDFGALFTAFHGVFFEAGSWRFPPDSTLLKLYPETFWVLAGAAAAGLIALQAVALELLARFGHQARRRSS